MQSQVGLPLANYSQSIAVRPKRSLPNIHSVNGGGSAIAAQAQNGISRKMSSPTVGGGGGGHGRPHPRNSVHVDVHHTTHHQDYENFR